MIPPMINGASHVVKRKTKIAGTVYISPAKQLKNNRKTNSREPMPDGAGMTPASIYAIAISITLCGIFNTLISLNIRRNQVNNYKLHQIKSQ